MEANLLLVGFSFKVILWSAPPPPAGVNAGQGRGRGRAEEGSRLPTKVGGIGFPPSSALTLNPQTLNPKPLNPKPQTPKP